jgi:hypothetical protein
VSGALESRIEAAYMDAAGVQRRPTCVQRERMTDLAKILARHDPMDGSPVHWTLPQLARALGFPVMGMSIREINDRYANRVKRTLRYLMTAGYVTGWEVAMNGREPVGILVSLPAGVAQSVRATRIRARGDHSSPHTSVRKRGRGEPFFSGQSVQSSLPPDPLKASPLSEDVERGGAREARTAASETRARARRSTKVRAALAKRRAIHGDEDGRAVVDALPWLAAVPVDIVAREAMRIELLYDRSLADEQLRRGRRKLATLALSPLWQARLTVAGRQLDRYANFGAGQAGAGAAIVIDLVRGDWQEWMTAPPRSLGAIAVCARRQARQWRRHDRSRRRGRTQLALVTNGQVVTRG